MQNWFNRLLKQLTNGDIDMSPAPHDGTLHGIINALDEDEHKMQMQIKRDKMVWKSLNRASPFEWLRSALK